MQFLERNANSNEYFGYVTSALQLLSKEMQTLESLICAIPYHKDYTGTFTLSPFEEHENLLTGLLRIDCKKNNNSGYESVPRKDKDKEKEEEGGEEGDGRDGRAKDPSVLFKVCPPAGPAAPYKPHYDYERVDVYGPGVGEQIDMCIKALEDAAGRELARINDIKVLNTTYLDDIKRLHKNKSEECTHTIRCTRVTTEEKACGKKIVFEYTQHSESINETINTAMKENRCRCNELLAPVKVSKDVFMSMFRVERVCRAICEEAATCAPEDRDRVAAAAKSVLHKVLEITSMHKVLWLVGDNFFAFLPSITTVLASTLTSAQDLVDYMAANRRIVPAFAKYFKPYNSVDAFPSVLSVILRTYDDENLLLLLESCNINSKKKAIASFLDKRYQSSLLHQKALLRYSSMGLSAILRSDFVALVEDAIRTAAEVHAHVLVTETWKVFDRSLVAQIPLDQAHMILQLLRDLTRECRSAKRPLYLSWVHSIGDFVFELVKAHIKDKNGDGGNNVDVALALEDEVYELYGTWLSVSPELGGVPWEGGLSGGPNVDTLLSYFADTVVLFGSVTGNEGYSRLWSFLAPLLTRGDPEIPRSVRDPIFHAFAGVTWKPWTPTFEDVVLAVDTLKDPSVASPNVVELFLRIANDVGWSALDFGATPAFYEQAALWAAIVVCRAPRAAESAVERMLQQWVLPMDWSTTAEDAEFHEALAAEWANRLFPILRTSCAQHKGELRSRGRRILLLFMKTCVILGYSAGEGVDDAETTRLEIFVRALVGVRGLTDDDDSIDVYLDCATAAFEAYVRLALKKKMNVDDDARQENEPWRKCLRMLFMLYNCPKSKAIRDVVRGVLERHPDMAPEFITVACDIVDSSSVLVTAVNEMVDAYFYSPAVSNLPYASRSWDDVADALSLVGKEDDFAKCCLAAGSFLALYAFHRKTRNDGSEEHYESHSWLPSIALTAGKKEHQLLLVAFGALERAILRPVVVRVEDKKKKDNGEKEEEEESNKAEIDINGDNNVNGDEDDIADTEIDLNDDDEGKKDKEENNNEGREEEGTQTEGDERGGRVSVAAVRRDILIATVSKAAEMLEKLGEDRSKEGIKGFFGRGEASTFSAKLRLSAKVLSIFLTSQILNTSGAVVDVRIDRTMTFEKNATAAAKKRIAGLLDNLHKDKKYTAEMDPEAMNTVLKKLDDMVGDPEVTVLSFGDLFTEIVRNLYQEKLEFYPLLK